MLTLAAVVLYATTAYAQVADLVIRNGTLLDGTGVSAFRADIAIDGGRIIAIGDLREAAAERVIDASGLFVTPGFIDLHSHADEGLADPERASAVNLITQGITTVVVGQDGLHAWPVGQSLDEQSEIWRRHGIGVNVVPLVGFSSARHEVLGPSHDPAGPDEALAVAARAREYLQQGAWGISTGLEYTPYVSTRELIVATRPAKEIDGFHISHLRDQGDHLLESIDELIEIGRETGVRVVATHIKASGHLNWGISESVVEKIAAARRAGILVYADLTPYLSGGFDQSLVPERFGPITEETPVSPELLAAIDSVIAARDGAARITIDSHNEDKLVGYSLAEASEARGVSEARTVVELITEGVMFRQIQASENDMIRFIRQPYVAASSDGWVVEYGLEAEHPRNYGAFPRRIRRYVYELEAIDLPFAIHTATGLTAEIIGLTDRGLLEVGRWADILVLDPPRVRDRSTYSDAHQYSQGILWVLVNGKVAVADGIPTGYRGGLVLVKSSSR